MSKKQYAFIKNNEVLNTLIIDEFNIDFIEFQKTNNNADQTIIIDDYETAYNAVIGGSFDGEKFWVQKPYQSWIKDLVNNTWVAPVPYPEDHSLVYRDAGINQVFYNWNENLQDWDLLPVLEVGYSYLWDSKKCLFESSITSVTIAETIDIITTTIEEPPQP